MSPTIWRSWEDNGTVGEVKDKNQDKHYKKPPVSEEMYNFVLSCYHYFCKLIRKKYGGTTETTKG